MKTVENPLTSVGIIVGRFQTHELHAGHIDLIQTICNKHPKVIIFLGLAPVKVTQNNPLDFEARKQMILERFPTVNVLYIKDTPSDIDWSKDLDEKIGDLTSPSQTVTLYGSRDSFINHYKGKYTTQELVQEVFISGTEVRKDISKKVKSSADFRAGVIWATWNQYAKVYPTVDIAIFDENYKKILLGRKPKENRYRFIGGFAEPNSDSYEADARREVQEEAGIEVTDMDYVGSFHIQDWRYAQEKDKIKTIFYACNVMFGRPEAGDDIQEVKWFDFKNFDTENLMSCHRILWKALVSWMRIKG